LESNLKIEDACINLVELANWIYLAEKQDRANKQGKHYKHQQESLQYLVE